MAKFSGMIGFGIDTEYDPENHPGVWKPILIERKYKGDLMRVSKQNRTGNNLNDSIVFQNEISIVADPFAFENYSNIRYVEYMHAKWKVSNVRVEYPRLILGMGEIYNGKKEEGTSSFAENNSW